MIKYNKNTKTFESKHKTFTHEEVSVNLVYTWIKSGELSLSSFKEWCKYEDELAYKTGKADIIAMF